MLQKMDFALGGGDKGYNLLKTEKAVCSNREFAINGLTNGKEYMLIISYGWSNTNISTLNIASATNTSNLTRKDGVNEYNGTQYCNTWWCIYTFIATGTSTTITYASGVPTTTQCRYFLFEKA